MVPAGVYDRARGLSDHDGPVCRMAGSRFGTGLAVVIAAGWLSGFEAAAAQVLEGKHGRPRALGLERWREAKVLPGEG